MRGYKKSPDFREMRQKERKYIEKDKKKNKAKQKKYIEKDKEKNKAEQYGRIKEGIMFTQPVILFMVFFTASLTSLFLRL